MPKRALTLSNETRDTISQLHPDVKRKVRAAIDAIRDDPTIGDPLEQELGGFRKIIIGSWRIVYRDERQTVRVHAIGRRATVYADLIERLRRAIKERRRPYRRAAGAKPASHPRRSRPGRASRRRR